jgi:hypothetical protein
MKPDFEKFTYHELSVYKVVFVKFFFRKLPVFGAECFDGANPYVDAVLASTGNVC